MSEPNKQQFGDGQDNYAGAAKQTGNAAKKIGKHIAKQAAKGTEATVNAAASTVKAGVESGKAIAEIAVGTASGGPWGAVISAAWSLRHTLYKILVCVCLFIVMLVIIIVSFPNIIFENIKYTFDGTETVETNTLNLAYEDLSHSVEGVIESAYEKAKEKAESIISDGKYDSELSNAYYEENLDASYNYDIAYILAAYSVSKEQSGTSKAELLDKLEIASDQLFTVVATEKNAEITREVDGETETVTVTYVVCSIELYDREIILEIFGVDENMEYKNYGITYREYAEYMALALSMTKTK